MTQAENRAGRSLTIHFTSGARREDVESDVY